MTTPGKVKAYGRFLLLLSCWFLQCKVFPPTQPTSQEAKNIPPVAIAKVDEGQTEFSPGQRVKLDGSASHDPDESNHSRQLLYRWRTLNGGQLEDTTTAVTYFKADSSGKYVITLIVIDADLAESKPAVLAISIKKIADTPVAFFKIIPADTTQAGVPVTLDGRASVDPNNDPLTFHWQSLDGGSIADSTAQVTTFAAHQAGTYVISLRVSDGLHKSERRLATIHVKAEANFPPLIKIKADTIIEKNVWAKLDASGSSDPEGEPLRFKWQKRNGGELANADQAMTQFRASASNIYVIELQATDARGAGAAAFVNIRVKGDSSIEHNHPPIAKAGQDQTTFIELPVFLDGSASFDPDGEALSYFWQALDGGAIENAPTKQARFKASAVKTFRVSLTVRDQEFSSNDTVRVIVLNRPPIAEAGNDTTIKVGEKAALNASRSRDPDGDPLTYRWQSLDGGQLDNPSAKITTFMSNTEGSYNLSLLVNDGREDSQRDLIKITVIPARPLNRVPIANAGKDDTTNTGIPVMLDGRLSSDPDGEALTYKWIALNGGTITDTKAAVTTFVATMRKTYVVALIVNDGQVDSDADYKEILIPETSPELFPPVANAGRDTTVLIGEKVKLDGSRSRDPNNLRLNFHWIGAESNPASVALPNVAAPEFIPPSPGKYIFILYVDNGQQTSAPDQVKIEVLEPNIYVSKTRPPAPNVFTTIKTGMAAAQSGDLIFVEPGEYDENVDNFKSNILLLSTDPVKTIITGKGRASALFLRNVNGVEIRGFTIIEGGRSDPQQIDVAGITCQDATSIRLIGNSILRNRGDGIRLYTSNGVVIKNNKIGNNAFNGIRSTTCSFEVENNEIFENGRNQPNSLNGSISIEARSGEDASSRTVQIRGNTFRDNEDNHIQAATNSVIIVEGDSLSGIGGIVTNDGAGAQLTLNNNTFRVTSDKTIFCRSKTFLNMQNNALDNTGIAGNRTGVEVSNLAPNSQITGNKITGCSIGLMISLSPIIVKQNIFAQNQIGIKAIGLISICASLANDNTFINNVKNVECP